MIAKILDEYTMRPSWVLVVGGWWLVVGWLLVGAGAGAGGWWLALVVGAGGWCWCPHATVSDRYHNPRNPYNPYHALMHSCTHL